MRAVQEAEFASVGKTTRWSAWSIVLVMAAITAILLTPAAYNRFPLIFPDTSAYFAVAYADAWPIDRAGFYGLWLSPALLAVRPDIAVWLAAAMQSATVSLAVIAVVRRLAPQFTPWRTVALVVVTAALTSLPWHTSQMIPDAVTGALILVAWLAAARGTRERGTPLLWLATAALTLTHFTHIVVVAAAAVTAITLAAFAGASRSETARRGIVLALTLASVLAAHTAVYGLYFDRWKPSPLGGYFLFARLYEDGLVPRWMDRHCGRDAPKPLCDLRAELPTDSQVLLWGGSHQSPLYAKINDRKDDRQAWAWVDMVSTAAIGSLVEEPVLFVEHAASATGVQLINYRALDDLCPDTCRNLRMFEWYPELASSVLQSRQLTGELPRGGVRAVTSFSATIGMILIIPFMVMAWRRKDSMAFSLLLTIAISFIANAAATGALSDVHDRYQSRVVWLAPFAILLLTARWREQRRAA